MSFRDFGPVKPPITAEIRRLVESCSACAAPVSWQFEFIDSIDSQIKRGWPPSDKQLEVLYKMEQGGYDNNNFDGF